jgi:hypothetical protein
MTKSRPYAGFQVICDVSELQRSELKNEWKSHDL